MIHVLLAFSLNCSTNQAWVVCPTPQQIEDNAHSSLNWLSGTIKVQNGSKRFELSEGGTQVLLMKRNRKDYIVVRDCEKSTWTWYPASPIKGGFSLGVGVVEHGGTGFSPF